MKYLPLLFRFDSFLSMLQAQSAIRNLVSRYNGFMNRRLGSVILVQQINEPGHIQYFPWMNGLFSQNSVLTVTIAVR